MNTKILSLTLLVISVGLAVTLPASAALSDADKAVIKVAAVSTLSNTGDYYYINTEINWDNTITFWFISKETDTDSSVMAISQIIGAYSGICRNHPDLSDCYLYIGTRESVNGRMYCLRTWIDNLGPNPSDTEAGVLVMMVINTFTAA